MAWVMPDNVPGWARTSVQWIVVGGALAYGYADMRLGVATALELGQSMNTQLQAINQQIATLDVDRSKQARMEADIQELRLDVKSLMGWREVINRERMR